MQLVGETNLLPRRKTARELALEVIRKAIVEGRLAAGQPLDDQTLAREMGVSRTPVREAISILQVQGFVSQRPFSRPVVSPLSYQQVEEVYMIRKSLESMATYFACLNMDFRQIQQLKRIVKRETRAIQSADALAWMTYNRRFHTCLYAASQKPFLCRYIDWLLDLSTFYMITTAEFLPARLAGSNQEHIGIIRACEQKNAELSKRLLVSHLETSAALLLEYVKVGASVASATRPTGGHNED